MHQSAAVTSTQGRNTLTGTSLQRVLGRHEHGLFAALLPLLPLLRLSARAVALLLSVLLEAALTRLLAPRRVGHGVVVVALDLLAPRGLVRAPPPGLDGFLRRLGRDQAVAPIANQVLPPGLDERLPHSKPVF